MSPLASQHFVKSSGATSASGLLASLRRTDPTYAGVIATQARWQPIKVTDSDWEPLFAVTKLPISELPTAAYILFLTIRTENSSSRTLHSCFLFPASC